MRYLKSFKLFEDKNHDYGCVMVDVPVKNWEEITSFIDNQDLYTVENDNTYGLQDRPHLTLLYGLHKEVTSEMVEGVLKDVKPFDIEIDGVDIFENEDYDVVKFNIKKTDILQSIFDELSKLPNSNSFKDYKPHITIAYVRKGTGKKYIKPNYKWQVNDIDDITYSMTNGEEFKILLDNYNTDNTPIIEGKGIPNIIKTLGKDITLDILDSLKNKKEPKLYNLLGKDINIKLFNKDIIDVRGVSKPYSIELHFNFSTINYHSLSRVVYHELLHIYEIINRIEKDSKYKLQWDINNILKKIESNYLDDPFISELCYLIYQSFDHEINARVSDVYPFLISLNISDENLLFDYLVKTKSWEYMTLLENWKPKWEIVNFNNLINFLSEFNSDVLLRFKDLNFNLYNIPKDEKEARRIIKDWSILFKKKSKIFKNKLIRVIDEVITDIDKRNNSDLRESRNGWLLVPNKSRERVKKIDRLLESSLVYTTKDGQILKYDSDWKLPNSPIRVQLERDLEDILLDIKDLGYQYQISGFSRYQFRINTSKSSPPYIWICNKSFKDVDIGGFTTKRIPINHEEIEDTLFRIEDYLNSMGFVIIDKNIINPGKNTEQIYIYFDLKKEEPII